MVESIFDISPYHLNTLIKIQFCKSSSILLNFSVLYMSVDILNTCRGGNQGGRWYIILDLFFWVPVDTNL